MNLTDHISQTLIKKKLILIIILGFEQKTIKFFVDETEQAEHLSCMTK